jgi:RNA polymerase sigma factor (sigma-70 family)
MVKNPINDEGGLTDGQLLVAFVERHEEAAFATLVNRHGPLVWGVCRRLLNQHDAEDAFQATFLVLLRKAASIQHREMLASWLYGVAHQTALRARRTMARRRVREKQVVDMPEPAATEHDLWNDMQPLLDRELSRLPEKYRVAMILCDVEGKTRKEVARQLGLPEGTVGSRLARARAMLAKRLARHGLAVSGGALAVVLSQMVASAAVPASVLSSTIKAATIGAISVKVAALTEGVLKSMLLTKLKIATVVILLSAAGLGIVAAMRWTTVSATPAQSQPRIGPARAAPAGRGMMGPNGGGLIAPNGKGIFFRGGKGALFVPGGKGAAPAEKKNRPAVRPPSDRMVKAGRQFLFNHSVA